MERRGWCGKTPEERASCTPQFFGQPHPWPAAPLASRTLHQPPPSPSPPAHQEVQQLSHLAPQAAEPAAGGVADTPLRRLGAELGHAPQPQLLQLGRGRGALDDKQRQAPVAQPVDRLGVGKKGGARKVGCEAGDRRCGTAGSTASAPSRGTHPVKHHLQAACVVRVVVLDERRLGLRLDEPGGCVACAWYRPTS